MLKNYVQISGHSAYSKSGVESLATYNQLLLSCHLYHSIFLFFFIRLAKFKWKEEKVISADRIDFLEFGNVKTLPKDVENSEKAI